MSQSRYLHLSIVHSLLRYIKGSPSKGIFLQATSFQLQAFTDADWASCLDTRKSTTSFWVFFFFRDSLVAWKAKK